MKLIIRRSAILFIFSLLLLTGLVLFLGNYINNASTWVQHSSNRHLYTDGKLNTTGNIYDRSGRLLLEMIEGNINFHEDTTIRTAVMHATGDLNDNVATGALVAFRDRLSGWNFFNGVYEFDDMNTSGNDITLNLDAQLCATAYRELAGHKGAVGIYNYETGEIICMVSTPSFDPAHPGNIPFDDPRHEGVYINRLLSPVYVPGSIFKLVTTAAAIDHIPHVKEKVYKCEGKIQIGEDIVSCLTPCGEVTLEQALATSCNTTFAQISLELGSKTLQDYANAAGFNSTLHVDGIQTGMGRVDLSDAEGANLAWAGIGQYTNTANPLNFMAFMGAIANGGVRVSPSLLSDEGSFASLIRPLIKKERIIPPKTAEKLGRMMRNNVTSIYGEWNFKGLELCAKTGTAEVGEGKLPHAWFAGYLDREDYPLAFVVIVENSGSGLRVAAPIAANILRAAVN